MASPDLEVILQMLRAMPPPSSTLDVQALRKLMQAMVSPPPSRVTATPARVGALPSEWLVPEGADPDVRLLYLHGGAYHAGSIDTHRALAGRIARAAGCVALTLDYRLAPEHAFPAAVEDAALGYAFVAANGPHGTAPARRLFVAGDSAGGGLALATLVGARDVGLPRAHAAALISPWTDLAVTGESIVTRSDADPVLPAHFIRPAAELYLAGHDARDPRASPLYADLTGLPPLLVHVGESEILLDDSTRLAERARAAGVAVALEVWPEMVHVWHSFSPLLREGREAIDRIGAFLRAHAG